LSILSELNTLLSSIPLPVETGVFSDAAPDEYVVITPLADTFEVYANNHPGLEVQEARISLFTKVKCLAGGHAGDDSIIIWQQLCQRDMPLALAQQVTMYLI
jgi:hypothetical protein